MGAAGAAPNKADPSWASSQRASASSHPPDEAPTHSIPRATLSEGANGGPAGAAGAAGAAPSQNALSILMVAVASAPAKIGAAAAKRCDKATAKPAKAERREGVSQKRPVSNMGAAGASSHTEAPADAGFASSEMPSRMMGPGYDTQGGQVQPTLPPRPPPRPCAPAPARRCTLMTLMILHALTLTLKLETREGSRRTIWRSTGSHVKFMTPA